MKTQIETKSYSLESSSEHILWKRFIDPACWGLAVEKFPAEPWRLYLKPEGEFPPEAWEYFKRALNWINDMGLAEPLTSPKHKPLDATSIVSINSLLLKGVPDLHFNSIRSYQPIFNVNKFEILNYVFQEQSIWYDNPDGLKIRVEGFWPKEKMSIDFFKACHELKKIDCRKNLIQWKEAVHRWVQFLSPAFNGTYHYWCVYFLTNPEEIKAQLLRIVEWYEKEVERIIDRYYPDTFEYREAVSELAVKMQRYIDITQFSFDASGRTSRLVQDCIFSQFGIQPPGPVLYFYQGRAWVYGTYLPLANALNMARQGMKYPSDAERA